MNKILKLTLILFLVSAIVAGVLGVVNELTKDRIAEIAEAKTAEAYATVLEADAYDEVDYTGDNTAITKISKAGDAGYVVEETVSGSQGAIEIVIGVDTDCKCTGISIIKSSETSGLGAVASSPSEKGVAFREQFIGVGDDVALAKNGGTINALTGATITSTAVTNAVANAIAAVESLG